MKRVLLALTLGLAVAAVPAVAESTGSTGSTSSSAHSSGLTANEEPATGAARLHGASKTHDELSGTATADTTTTSTLRQDNSGTVTTSGSAEVQETRTNPDAASLAPGGGLTLTGTVVSWNDQEIVVRTTTGIEHVVIQPDTRRPSTFTEGQVVSIDYNRTSQNGVMIAEQIRPGEAPVVARSGVDVESELEQDVEAGVAELGEEADELGAEISQLDDELEQEIEEETGRNLDNDSTIGDSVTADMDDDTPETLGANTTLDTSLPATAGESPLVALLGLVALGAAAGLRRLF